MTRRTVAPFTPTPNARFRLLCLPDRWPPEVALMVVLETLLISPPKKGEWVVAAGTSPSHWRGLTQWILLSDDVPEHTVEAVLANLRANDCADESECNEMTTLENEPFVTPRFTLGPKGLHLLVKEADFDPKWVSPLALPLKMRVLAERPVRRPTKRS